MEDCCACTRKCKRIAVEEEHSTPAPGLYKRMRTCDSPELHFVSTNYDLQNRHFSVSSPENSGGLAAVDSGLSFCSDHQYSLASSRCSSNAESCEVVNEHNSKSTDLEAKSSETETESSTCINSKLSSRETTPVSGLSGGGDCNDMESQSQPKKQSASHRSRPSADAKKPSNVEKLEIEEFFSAAEKYEQQRFAEKYNFDIVKEVPLEGRYQWVRLKP